MPFLNFQKLDAIGPQSSNLVPFSLEPSVYLPKHQKNLIFRANQPYPAALCFSDFTHIETKKQPPYSQNSTKFSTLRIMLKFS